MTENIELTELRNIIATASMGIWHIELVEGKEPRLIPDDKMKELLGISDCNYTPEEAYKAWFSRIKPEALPSVLESVAKMQKGLRDENTYLWQHPTKGERYVRCGGTAVKIPGGYLLRGYHYDVDQLVRHDIETQQAVR